MMNPQMIRSVRQHQGFELLKILLPLADDDDTPQSLARSAYLLVDALETEQDWKPEVPEELPIPDHLEPVEAYQSTSQGQELTRQERLIWDVVLDSAYEAGKYVAEKPTFETLSEEHKNALRRY